MAKPKSPKIYRIINARETAYFGSHKEATAAWERMGRPENFGEIDAVEECNRLVRMLREARVKDVGAREI